MTGNIDQTYLENTNITLPTVQTCAHVPASKVTMIFPKDSNPTVRQEIASLLLMAYQSKRRSNEHGE